MSAHSKNKQTSGVRHSWGPDFLYTLVARLSCYFITCYTYMYTIYYVYIMPVYIFFTRSNLDYDSTKYVYS